MDMSGMDMGGMDMTSSSSSSSLVMSMTSSAMSSATSTVMNMVSSTSSPTSSASPTGMDMDMSSHSHSSSSNDSMDMSSMSMNSYLTTHYDSYPVLFKSLTASSGGAAFGIFVFIFFLGFFLRGLFFLSAYLEQRVYHNYTNAVVIQEIDNCECGPDADEQSNELKGAATTDHRVRGFSNIVKSTFFPGAAELAKDAVRLVIAFVAAMFGYGLMLAAMSFVVLYFFAACLGIAFGEVFFNRLSMVLQINKNSSMCGSLH